MSPQLTREELRAGIKQRIEERDVLFQKVTALYFDTLHERIKTLEKEGHTATAFDLECRYSEFVQSYHSFCDTLATPRWFVSTRRLRHVYKEWGELILLGLSNRPAYFLQLADPAKEVELRMALAAAIDTLAAANKNIDSIISWHIEEIREKNPSVLGALARIPTLTQLRQKWQETAHFDDLRHVLIEADIIARQAQSIHLALAQQFEK